MKIQLFIHHQLHNSTACIMNSGRRMHHTCADWSMNAICVNYPQHIHNSRFTTSSNRFTADNSLIWIPSPTKRCEIGCESYGFGKWKCFIKSSIEAIDSKTWCASVRRSSKWQTTATSIRSTQYAIYLTSNNYYFYSGFAHFDNLCSFNKRTSKTKRINYVPRAFVFSTLLLQNFETHINHSSFAPSNK